MELASIKDLETDQAKICLVKALKESVCKTLLEFVDIQIECFMYPNDPKRFTRIFKDNKMLNETCNKEGKAKNYPSSMGIGHSALFSLIYIRQKTNSLRSLNEQERSPTELVEDLNKKLKSIGEVYNHLNELYHSYLMVKYNNIGHQKLLGDFVIQSDFMFDILRRYATITSSVAKSSENNSRLVGITNHFIEDTNIFYKRIISNSNAYAEYDLVKHGVNRNSSEETLVELEFKKLDVSGMHLDDEFDDFLQNRKVSLKITHRRVI
ncbi:hypothetical protein SEUBUCD646_0G01570 [Saccharomyces eubayanus]|uniref:Uncharacterized protein n=2 Tax=Saccharomyces TaxID=4930 RepID=A0A6C1E8S6_SACPS|nr:hypothetical protein GRS66_007515 [Saccharomyces pastorianus]CAI1990041.1 hypothetical protein SEUBUCD650_0G01580 [Saccharomyces eubayanus]CAI2014714.1 hypothetical protein SEUBUCD646_0G01570 [Saccharomyces eubayanus]